MIGVKLRQRIADAGVDAHAQSDVFMELHDDEDYMSRKIEGEFDGDGNDHGRMTMIIGRMRRSRIARMMIRVRMRMIKMQSAILDGRLNHT